MIENVINKRNMRLAYQHVLKNKGSAGVDGMQLKELTTYVKQHRDEIAMALTKGDYKVQPILGVSMASSTKSDFSNYNNFKTATKERIRINAGLLLKSSSTI